MPPEMIEEPRRTSENRHARPVVPRSLGVGDSVPLFDGSRGKTRYIVVSVGLAVVVTRSPVNGETITLLREPPPGPRRKVRERTRRRYNNGRKARPRGRTADRTAEVTSGD